MHYLAWVFFFLFFGSTHAESLAPKEGAKLRSEFLKAQSSEILAFQHRQSFEAKELQASQRMRTAEFTKNFGKDRSQYFNEHPTSLDRRQYEQDLIKKKNQFFLDLKNELNQKNMSNQQKLKEIQARQKNDKQRFEEYLKRGEVPPGVLWPKSGI